MSDSDEGIMATNDNHGVIAQRHVILRTALQRLVLLRETGPKSAAWNRARVKTMWRLQQQLMVDADAAQPKQTNE